MAKATFLLVMLFGVHNIGFKIVNQFLEPTERNKDIIKACEDLSESVSGFIVSIAYCYSNGEVLSVIKEFWNRRRRGY